MIRHKLRAGRGATLSEMLVALAIVGLTALAVATGITASLRVYRDSVALSDAQTLASTLSQALMDDLRYARDIRADGSGGLTYTSAQYGLEATVDRNEDGRLSVNGHDLVGAGAYAGLTADVSLDWDGACVAVELSILSGTEPVRTVNFSVRPLNPQKEAG